MNIQKVGIISKKISIKLIVKYKYMFIIKLEKDTTKIKIKPLLLNHSLQLLKHKKEVYLWL